MSAGVGDHAVGLERLRQVLAAYGADPRRWPAGERAALVAVSREADSIREQIAQERALDAALDSLGDVPDVPDAAIGRTLAAAGVGSGATVIDFATARPVPGVASSMFRPAMGWIAASLLLGLVIGSSRIADRIYLNSVGEGGGVYDDPGKGNLDPGFLDDNLGLDGDGL